MAGTAKSTGTTKSTSKTLVKPVAIAKELGIRPQIVYGWVKSGKLKTYTQGDFTNMVDANEVRAIQNKSSSRTVAGGGRRAPGTGPRKVKDSSGTYVDEGIRSPLKPGDIVSWGAKETRRVGVVERENEYLTTLKTMEEKKELEATFTNTSLYDLIKTGKMTLESPDQLLGMILTNWRHVGDFKTANSLALWMRDHNMEAELYEHYEDNGEDEPIPDAPWVIEWREAEAQKETRKEQAREERQVKRAQEKATAGTLN